MNELSKLAVAVKKVIFPHPIIIEGGIYKTAEQIREVAPSDAIPSWGSMTTDGGDGNGGGRDYHAEYYNCDSGHRVLLYTQNALGLPNPGMKYAEKHAPELIPLYDDLGKPLILNISGQSVDDLLQLLKRAIAAGFRVIVVNGSCPNKKGMPILCYDTDAVSEFFHRADREIGPVEAVILWKVSLTLPRPILQHNCMQVVASQVFNGIINGNTIPNALQYDERGKTTILTEKNKITRGGMGGPAVQPFAIDQTEFCAAQLPPNKIAVMTGGIGDVAGIRKAFQAGATLVGMNSCFSELGGQRPEFVTELLVQLTESV